MTTGNIAALQMLLATYDDAFLDSVEDIKKLLEEIYDDIEITTEEIEQFLISVDYDKWSENRQKLSHSR